MKKSFFGDLWRKAFRSGSPLNLFIAINVCVFLLVNVLSLVTALQFTAIPLSEYLLSALRLPADPIRLLIKPWTLLTYMFSQQGFFHLLFNMLWLYWMGMIFLDFLKKRQFVFVYLAGGLAGAVFFLLAYNFIPAFANQNAVLIGASASVSAVIFATATLLPDYSIRMLFFGNVRLKYLAVAFMVLDILAMSGLNAGGSIAHIGGALFGFLFIKQLQNGRDWSKVFAKRERRKMKVVRNNRNTLPSYEDTLEPNQEVVDRILDKISQSGYDSLTKAEKEALFKASKQGQNEY